MSTIDTEKLLSRLCVMGDADVSVLEAGHTKSKTDETWMGTAAGSANDQLWGDFVALGWVSKKMQKIDVPEAALKEFLAYKIEEKGMQPIGELLERRLHIVKMTRLYNENYSKIVQSIVDPVQAKGGKPIDVAKFIASIMAEAVNYAFTPAHSEKILEDICAWSKERLKQRVEKKLQKEIE